MTDWASRLADETARFPQRVKGARAFYAREGSRLQRYHGGTPVGFMAAIAEWESGGRMVASGDQDLAEYGYFQVAGNTPMQFGVHADVRRSEEGNIFLAALHFQVAAFRLNRENPEILNGSEDQWKMARMVFAIGRGGTDGLIRRAREAGLVRGPGMYNAIRTFVDAGSVPQLGTQEPGKVWFRVHAIQIQWNVGREVDSSWPGAPVRIPAFVPYQLPEGVTLPNPGAGIGAIALAVGAAALLRRVI